AYNLGNALARAGRYADAIAAYDDALARKPDDEDAETNRQLVTMLLDAQKQSAAPRIAGSADSVATETRDKPGGASNGDEIHSRGPEGAAGGRETDSQSGAAAGGAVARAGTAGGANPDAQRSQRAGSGTNQGGLGPGSGRGETLLEDPFRMGRP